MNGMVNPDSSVVLMIVKHVFMAITVYRAYSDRMLHRLMGVIAALCVVSIVF